jgi:3-methyladenine DNA glycosylase AlkD
MKTKEILTQLKALGDEKVCKHYKKAGATGKYFGVKLGEIRKLAKKIKTNHGLALELWATENIDARFVAILLMTPKSLSADELDELVRSINFVRVADWFNSYVVKDHPDAESLREGWMDCGDPMGERAGWNLTSTRVRKESKGLNLAGLLKRIESEMGAAPEEVQWTMNFVLVEIGINHPKHRKRALAIGEKLGVFSDFPASKGCTSPFAPIWINTMVERQG